VTLLTWHFRADPATSFMRLSSFMVRLMRPLQYWLWNYFIVNLAETPNFWWGGCEPYLMKQEKHIICW